MTVWRDGTTGGEIITGHGEDKPVSNNLLDLDEADRYFTDTRGEKPLVNLGISGGSMTEWETKRRDFLSGVEWAKNKIFKI